MRASRYVLLLIAALSLLTPVRAMTNADLLKMKEAGISEDTIVYAMGIHPAEYDASPDALVALKKAGLSDIVILKLISLQSPAKRPDAPEPASPTEPEAPATAPEPASPPAPVPANTAPPNPAAAAASSAPSPDHEDARAATSSDPATSTSRSSATNTPDTKSATAATPPEPPAAKEPAEKAPAAIPPLAYPAVGNDYYTRCSFHYERGRFLTTNYARGKLVPINTRVKLISMADDELVLQRLDTRDRVRVKNVEKHSRKPVVEIARLMLSADKMPVDEQPREIAVAIREGELREGMTREQALMARGYPPAHRTPSLDAEKWVYWSSRFIRHTVTFKDGRLLDGRGVEERDTD